jgi:spore coat protein U-like protein
MARPGYAARLLAALAVTSLSQPARAGTDTDVLTVTATVLSACSLSGGTLAFGSYISGPSDNADVDGIINYVNCSGTLTFARDGGGSGNISARQMSNGANRLRYQIYRNSARNAVWGIGADAQTQVLLETRNGLVTVYGRIPGGQVVPAGTYTDTVNVTLTF